MECRKIDDKDDKCQCKTCNNMKDNHCKHLDSCHMCDKCAWSGYVHYCPNKILKEGN